MMVVIRLRRATTRLLYNPLADYKAKKSPQKRAFSVRSSDYRSTISLSALSAETLTDL
jgi:hypothetical protein